MLNFKGAVGAFEPMAFGLGWHGFGFLGAKGAGLPTIPGFLNFTGGNLTAFNTGMAAYNAGVRNVKIQCFGDSTNFGIGSGTGGLGAIGCQPNSWPAQLTGLISGARNAWIAGEGNIYAFGSNLPAADTRVTLDAGWAQFAVSTLGGLFMSSSTAASAYHFTPTTAFDTIIIGSTLSAGGSDSTVSVDAGGTLATITGSGANTMKYTTINCALGTHTINFKNVSAAAAFCGSIYCYNSAVKEISIQDCGYISATSTMLTASASVWGPLVQATVANNAPDLALCENGIINDYGVGIGLGPSLANNQTIITGFKNAGSSVILMSGAPSNPATYSYALQNSYVQQMRNLAYSNNVPMIDIWTLLRNRGDWVAGDYFDNLHPNTALYGVIAGYVNQAIQPGFRAA